VSTSKETIAFIEDQLGALDIRTAPMFGEYGIYCDGKIVGLICDDTLFIKPSDAPADVLVGTEPGPPYPGAKNYSGVPGELLENRVWLQTAIQATADALPTPPPKKPKKPKPAPAAGGLAPPHRLVK
jgi:TfoX/Sxy family transcriptional regulator of competence genes